MNINVNIKNARENTMNNLSIFMTQMKEMGLNNKYKVIEEIIELHFKYDSKEILLRNLIQHLSESFKVNIYFFLDYLKFNEYFEIEMLKLDKTFVKDLTKINEIKLKYGIFIGQLMQISQEPFIINSVETSINNNNSLHSIKFTRADGESLKGQFTPENLIATITLLLNSLQASMQVGIYNLNENSIFSYLEQSKQLNTYLTELMLMHKKRNEAAADIDLKVSKGQENGR